MLVALSIRDIVLIDHLNLEFGSGLNILTGETGAGKSIILDALGLATGARADKGLVRQGVGSGSVTACFRIEEHDALLNRLSDQGIEIEVEAGCVEVLLRREQSSDGRSRAFINDQAVSVAFLREVGDKLLEIHGQHSDRGLLNLSTHRAFVDQFGGHEATLEKVRIAFERWSSAKNAYNEALREIAEARAQVDYLRHVLHELRELNPQPSEEETLSSQRTLMMNAEKVCSDLTVAKEDIDGGNGLVRKISTSLRRLESYEKQLGGRLDPLVRQLDSLLTEAYEAQGLIDDALSDLAYNPRELEASEERLFALRAVARKHNVQVDDLADLLTQFEARLEQAEAGEAELDALEQEVAESEAAYIELATRLSEKRTKAAAKLARRVETELKPLKLDKVKFLPEIRRGDLQEGGIKGIDQVEFMISTNPGAPFGSLMSIASGGELSRVLLALQVSLAAKGGRQAMIFDEVDQGVGGAVADAVGSRLSELAKWSQIFVVTHSPQVAARADRHWYISKTVAANDAVQSDLRTQVRPLDDDERREEIARMLAGQDITQEARAAAERLIVAGAG